VLIGRGHIPDPRVQPDRVVLEPDPFELNVEHARVGDLFELGPLIL